MNRIISIIITLICIVGIVAAESFFVISMVLLFNSSKPLDGKIIVVLGYILALFLLLIFESVTAIGIRSKKVVASKRKSEFLIAISLITFVLSTPTMYHLITIILNPVSWASPSGKELFFPPLYISAIIAICAICWCVFSFALKEINKGN